MTYDELKLYLKQLEIPYSNQEENSKRRAEYSNGMDSYVFQFIEEIKFIPHKEIYKFHELKHKKDKYYQPVKSGPVSFIDNNPDAARGVFYVKCLHVIPLEYLYIELPKNTPKGIQKLYNTSINATGINTLIEEIKNNNNSIRMPVRQFSNIITHAYYLRDTFMGNPPNDTKAFQPYGNDY